VSAASLRPEDTQLTADKSAATGTQEDAALDAPAAAESEHNAVSSTGPAQLLPPPFAGHTSADSAEPAAAMLTRSPSEGAKHAIGNVRISTEADALRAQAAAQQQQQHGGGFAAARAFGDRLLGAPLRDSSELVRSGLFSLVSSVARAPGSVLGRTASSVSSAMAHKTPEAQSPTAPIQGGLAAAAVASKAPDAAGIGAASRPGSATAATDVKPTAGPAAVSVSSRGTFTKAPAVEVTVSATADADRPVRIAMSVRLADKESPATGSSAPASNSAGPQAAEAYRQSTRVGLGGWLGRGGGGVPPSPPSAAPAAAEKQADSPPAASVQRQPSLPSASARIGSFFRRGAPGVAPAAETAGGAVQPAATQAPASQGVVPADKASNQGQTSDQIPASTAAEEPPGTPASVAAAEASANSPSAERSAVSATSTSVVSGAASSPLPAASPSRGKLDPDERRKLRVALQMAAQLRQVPAVSPSDGRQIVSLLVCTHITTCSRLARNLCLCSCNGVSCVADDGTGHRGRHDLVRAPHG